MVQGKARHCLPFSPCFHQQGWNTGCRQTQHSWTGSVWALEGLSLTAAFECFPPAVKSDEKWRRESLLGLQRAGAAELQGKLGPEQSCCCRIFKTCRNRQYHCLISCDLKLPQPALGSKIWFMHFEFTKRRFFSLSAEFLMAPRKKQSSKGRTRTAWHNHSYLMLDIYCCHQRLKV